MPLGSDRTKRAYEQWAAQYDQDPNPQLVLEFEDVLRVVDPKPGEAILDAACGTGRYTVAFHTRGADVLGIDFSAGMVAQARRKNPALRFVIADLREPLPLVADTFDAVNCAQALKHLPSLRTPVTEFARVLKPGGILRLLEYVRPRGPLRSFIAGLWEPWIAWAYGAGFDRRTEEHVREVGLEILEVRFAVDDLVKLISVRAHPTS